MHSPPVRNDCCRLVSFEDGTTGFEVVTKYDRKRTSRWRALYDSTGETSDICHLKICFSTNRRKLASSSELLFGSKLGFGQILDSLYTGQFGGVHAFGTLEYKLLEMALTHFGRDPRNSDSLRGRRISVFGPPNNAWFHRFPVGQILRHLNTTTSIGVAMKTFRTEFWKCYRKGRFSKNAKISYKISTSCDLRPP